MTYQNFNGTSKDSININLSELRAKMRESLKNNNQNTLSEYLQEKNFNTHTFDDLFQSIQSLQLSFLGMLWQRFPVFLTPSPTFNINELIRNPFIRICWDNNYWYIVKNYANCRNLEEADIIFSFDLPNDLFELYADNNMLTQSRALALKEEFMSSIQIIFKNTELGIMSSLELKLDPGWIEDIRSHIRNENRQ